MARPPAGIGDSVMLPVTCALPTLMSPRMLRLTTQLVTGTTTGASPLSGGVKVEGPTANVQGIEKPSQRSGRKQSLMHPCTLSVTGIDRAMLLPPAVGA